ncbi:MAG: hypothetical protein WCO04_18715 [Pseudomonadota bacterium]|jgi:predicted  nucleic acid-binding Zn-ribbon protein
MSLTRNDKQQNDYLAAILNEVRALKDQVKNLEKEIKDLKKAISNHTHQ